jgi:hypothetical protein
MLISKASGLAKCHVLIVPLRAAKGKAMPRQDPLPGPRLSLLGQFRRIMLWVALFAIAIAAIAVLLVARGDNGTHVHMLIAVALGAGLAVLLAGALMSLVFLGANSGHDEAATRFEEDKQP